MNKELNEILGHEINNVPVVHLSYKGDRTTFVTWTITGESPALSANDEVLYSICSVDVDIFSISNYLDLKKTIKIVMKNSGWVWVEDSEEMYEEDTKLYHQTCSFEKERIL